MAHNTAETICNSGTQTAQRNALQLCRSCNLLSRLPHYAELASRLQHQLLMELIRLKQAPALLTRERSPRGSLALGSCAVGALVLGRLNPGKRVARGTALARPATGGRCEERRDIAATHVAMCKGFPMVISVCPYIFNTLAAETTYSSGTQTARTTARRLHASTTQRLNDTTMQTTQTIQRLDDSTSQIGDSLLPRSVLALPRVRMVALAAVHGICMSCGFYAPYIVCMPSAVCQIWQPTLIR